MSKKVKLVIFDLDGTLVNAYPAIVRSFDFTMRRLGLPKQENRVIHRAVGWGDKNLLKPFVPKEKLDTALRIYRRHHKISLRQATTFLPQAQKLLQRLKKDGYKIAIASNRPTKFSWVIIRHLKMEKVLDYVLCGDKLEKAKPHPEILRRILRRFRLSPKEAVYVGDMTVDVKAGKRAGVKVLAIPSASSSKKELALLKPYALIHKRLSVLTIIDKLK